MIIECPNCGTKYTVREEAIKPRGRTVRCSSCGQKWHADGAPPIVVAQTAEEEPLQSDYEMEDAYGQREHPAHDADHDGEPEAFESEDASPFLPERAEDTDFVSAVPRLRSEEPQAARSWKLPAAMILAASVAFILLGLAAAHGPLSRIWPATNRLYRAAGLAASAPGEGLSLRNARAVLDAGPNGKGLTIQAEVVNTSSETRVVPLLKVSPLPQTETGKVFTVNSGVAKLPPQGTVSIKTSFSAQGLSVEKILLTFSPDNPVDSR